MSVQSFSFQSPGPTSFIGSASGLFIVLFFIATAIVHLGFAIAVASDIARHRRDNRITFGGGPFLWFLATLLGGVFVLSAYWLMTYSTLSPRIAQAIGKPTPKPQAN